MPQRCEARDVRASHTITTHSNESAVDAGADDVHTRGRKKRIDVGERSDAKITGPRLHGLRRLKRPAALCEIVHHLHKVYDIVERRACKGTGFLRSSQRYKSLGDLKLNCASG